MSREKTYVNNSKPLALDLSSSRASEGFSSSFRTPSRDRATMRSEVGKSSVGDAKSGYSSSYFYGNAAPAIFPEFEPEKKKTRKRSEEVEFRSTPKQDKKQKQQRATSPKTRVVATFASFVLLFGAIGFINITLTSMAVASSAQSQTLSTEIYQQREDGKALEVEYGILSNPATVKEKAIALGMESPSNVIQINLGKDSVLTKDDGTIALSSTLKEVAKQ